MLAVTWTLSNQSTKTPNKYVLSQAAQAYATILCYDYLYNGIAEKTGKTKTFMSYIEHLTDKARRSPAQTRASHPA